MDLKSQICIGWAKKKIHKPSFLNYLIYETSSSTSTTTDSTEKKSIRVLCSHCEKILVPIEEEIAIEEAKPKPHLKLEVMPISR